MVASLPVRGPLSAEQPSRSNWIVTFFPAGVQTSRLRSPQRFETSARSPTLPTRESAAGRIASGQSREPGWTRPGLGMRRTARPMAVSLRVYGCPRTPLPMALNVPSPIRA
jgi:hypothetical protein